MADVLDTFTRADANALGTADSGHVWQLLRGTVAIRGGRAHPVASNALAVVDAGPGGQDAALQLALGAGGGQALYLRVADANNYWRAVCRHYSYTYQSGTQSVFSHYENVWVGSTTYYTYQAEYKASTFGTSQYRQIELEQSQPPPTYSTWTSVYGQPYEYYHYNDGQTYRLWSDPTFTTSRTENHYSQQPVYVQQPVYATAYAYEVRLEKCVGGNLSPMIAKNVGAGSLSQLRVTAQGSTLSLFSSNSPTTAHGTVTDGAHASATRHGIGYAETSELSNSTGVDEFRVAPYNTPPGAPSLLAPIGNEVLRLAEPQTFRLRQNDPDAGDVITRTDWEWQLAAGGTVTPVTQQGASAQITRPANTFTAGGWQWRARTYDRAGAPSPWSGWAYFTAGVPPEAPAFTSPTNNAVLSDPETPVSWATAQQEAYELRVLGDSAGAPNEGQVLAATGTVVSTSRNAVIPRPENGRVEHTQVRVRYLGLWSEWGSVRNEVQFTPPAVALLALAVDGARGYMLATITHPASSGSQPLPQYAELWRRRSGTTKATLIASNLGPGTVVDARVQHRVDYEYQVITVGTNGARSYTPWITTAAGGGSGVVVRPLAPVMQVPATDVQLDSLRTSWQPSANAVDYIVQRRTAGASEWVTVGVIAGTSYLHTGLSAGTAYEVQVIARAASGAASDPSTILRTSTASLPATRVTATRSASWAVRGRVMASRATSWNTQRTPVDGGTSSSVTGAQRFVIRGGGWVTGLVIAPDGATYCRTDVGGAYRWDAEAQRWWQMVTKTGRPDESLAYAVQALGVAPSDSSRVYLATGFGTGYVHASSDGGRTFPVRSSTTFPIHGNANPRANVRLAVDPANKDHVLFGTMDGRLMRSTDGAASFEQVGSLPAQTASDGRGVTCIAFVPGSPVVSGRTQHLYASQRGVGLLRSTDGGGSWTTAVSVTGAFASDLVVDSSSTAWCVFRDGEDRGAWKVSSAGAGTKLAPLRNGNWTTIAVNPQNPSEAVLFDEGIVRADYGYGPVGDGRFERTTNGGSSWTEIVWDYSNGAKGTQWPRQADLHNWLSVGMARFTPDGSTLWFSEGMGMWRTPRPTSGTLTWEFASDGIEELVSSDAAVAPDGAWITAHWDRGIMRTLDPMNENPGPGGASTLPLTGAFGSAWDLGQSPTDPNLLVACLDSHNDWEYGYEKRSSSYSTDGGKTWTRFASLTNRTHPNDLRYGNIAISAGTGANRDNFVWSPSQHPNGPHVYWTKDRGATWTAVRLPGGTDRATTHAGHFLRKHASIVAHPTTPGTFYVCGNDDSNGETFLWRTTDGGVTWSRVTTNLRNGYWDLRFHGGLSIAGGYLFVWPGHHDGGSNPYWRAPLADLSTFTEFDTIKVAKVAAAGPPLEGKTNPTLLTSGRRNAGDSDTFHVSTDLGVTWTEAFAHPHGIFDFVDCIVAHPTIPGRFVVGYSGVGFQVLQLLGTTGPGPVGGGTTPGLARVSTSRSTSWTTAANATQPTGPVFVHAEPFDAGLGGYTLGQGLTATDANLRHTTNTWLAGGGAARLESYGAGQPTARSAWITIPPGYAGKTLRLEVRLRQNNAVLRSAQVWMTVIAADGGWRADSSYAWQDASSFTSGQWREASTDTIPNLPADYDRVQVYWRMNGAVAGDVIYADELVVTIVEPA